MHGVSRLGLDREMVSTAESVNFCLEVVPMLVWLFGKINSHFHTTWLLDVLRQVDCKWCFFFFFFLSNQIKLSNPKKRSDPLLDVKHQFTYLRDIMLLVYGRHDLERDRKM